MKQYSFDRIPQPPAVALGRTLKGLEQNFTQFYEEGNQLASVKHWHRRIQGQKQFIDTCERAALIDMNPLCPTQLY